jgi:4-hydroxy-3-methylbut-2-enyl diphosphate reductase
MLMSESLEIGEMFRQAMLERYGEAELASRYLAFDTICSATQERQDAVVALLDDHRLDVMIVVGGYNSSNTCNLANICAARVPTYHIAEPAALASADEIRHRPVMAPGSPRTPVGERVTTNWLSPGPVVVGLTAGASTPNSIIGEVVERLDRLANETP